jgi:hypothetical protein
MLNLGSREWNDLLLCARQKGLLPRLAEALADRQLLDRVPYKVRTMLRAAMIAADSSQTAIRFEINRVMRALRRVEVPVILLKGSAYVMAGLTPARGRFVGDLDLMVPLAKIDEVEQTLIVKGWAGSDMEAYDQRYYREWMHEVPPLQHPERETPVDLHHNIAPRTSRVHPDAMALFDASVALGNTQLRVLSSADMVLHSGVHLFNDEVAMPLRDLFDLHDLLCEFGARAKFWEELQVRAQLHGLGRPLYYILRNTRRHLRTPIPPEVERAAAAYAPGLLLGNLMDWLFAAHFSTALAEETSWTEKLARWMLYLRAHWLRMPAHMLVRHLAIKAWRRVRERFRSDSSEPEL